MAGGDTVPSFQHARDTFPCPSRCNLPERLLVRLLWSARCDKFVDGIYVWGGRLGQVLVFAKIRAALGIMSTVISGGGSLAGHLDDFYETLALPVLNGWGLTETSPVLACRRNMPRENVRGTVGLPTPGTAVRVVHPETLRPVPEGQQVCKQTYDLAYCTCR